MLQIGHSHGILPFNAQFDDQFPHIDGRRTGKAERLAADRVEESELGRHLRLRTGKGEKGSAAIIVTSDVGGAAGSKATFACDVKAIGTPDEFDYNPATQSAEPAKAVKAVKG